jgi:NO-binding membrane sensor protein with MHYT domain
MFGSRVQIFAIIATAGLFLAVFELVRRRRLMERYALLWLFSAAILLGLSVWRDALESFSSAIGIYYAPSAFFVAALAAILAMLLHFSLVISRLADQVKVLAQRLAAQQARIDQLEAQARQGEPVEVEAPLD